MPRLLSSYLAKSASSGAKDCNERTTRGLTERGRFGAIEAPSLATARHGRTASVTTWSRSVSEASRLRSNSNIVNIPFTSANPCVSALAPSSDSASCWKVLQPGTICGFATEPRKRPSDPASTRLAHKGSMNTKRRKKH